MFKIGDFSRLGQVSTRMLRHYDQLGLLKPKHTDKFSGYRYYTIDQLGDLNRIIALKELGLSLEQIAQIMNDVRPLNADKLRGMLMMKRSEIELTLSEEQARLGRVEARLRQIELEDEPSPYEVLVKPIPGIVVASVRTIAPTIDSMGYYCAMLYGQLYQGLRGLGITPLQPEITLYHNEDYVEADLDVEVSVPVHPKYQKQELSDNTITFRKLPAHELAATVIYEGRYEELMPAVLSLLRWIGVSDHVPAGPLRELHLSGPAHVGGEVVDSAVIEFQVPIQIVNV